MIKKNKEEIEQVYENNTGIGIREIQKRLQEQNNQEPIYKTEANKALLEDLEKIQKANRLYIQEHYPSYIIKNLLQR